MSNRARLEQAALESLSAGARRAFADPHEWARRAAASLDSLGARAILPEDPDFPPGLRALDAPPRALFTRGGALPPLERAVAIVGARAASSYGLGLATRLAVDLARMGFVVVSGLARGVDGAAHRGALAAEGGTVAVLPSGLDCVAPRHHRDLAGEIAASGALVTELAIGGPRFRSEFVRRNRLIAALSAATVVVEAGEKSGASSTARVAQLLGRPVLAVPGDVDRPTSRGTNELLRNGAIPCASAGDVARAVGRGAERIPPPAGGAAGGADPQCGAEERLLAALESRALSLEDVAARAGLDLPQALSGLLALQWAGAAVACPGQRWARAGG